MAENNIEKNSNIEEINDKYSRKLGNQVIIDISK